MPLLVAVAWGLILVVLSGGSIRRLEDAELWMPGVLISLFVVQGLARGRLLWEGTGSWGLVVWALVSILLVAVAWRSHTKGLSVVSAGILANLVVVLLNGYMPVPNGTAVTSTAGIGASFYVAANDGTLALFLGDVLRLDLLGAQYFLSVGDVLLGVGSVVYLLESSGAASGLTPSQTPRGA